MSSPSGTSIMFQDPDSLWSQENESIVKGPFSYLASHPGKDLRTLLLEAFNDIVLLPSSQIHLVAEVVAMLHTASLLIDDVEDNANLRRGNPASHCLFGTPQTINSANYVYFLAMQKVLSLSESPNVMKKLVQIFTEEMLNLHRGQGMDLHWRDGLVCPDEQQYYEMVMNKTGGLFRLAIRLMVELSVSDRDFSDLLPLANSLGIVYQVKDDYLNLQSAAYEKNKGFCEDLTEGKFSFPIIHSIRSDTSNKEIINILKQKTTDEILKSYAVSYMSTKTKTFEYTEETIVVLTETVRKILEQVVEKHESYEGVKFNKINAIVDRMCSLSQI